MNAFLRDFSSIAYLFPKSMILLDAWLTPKMQVLLLFSLIAAIPLIISLRLLRKRRQQMKQLDEIKQRIKELSRQKQEEQQKKP